MIRYRDYRLFIIAIITGLAIPVVALTSTEVFAQSSPSPSESGLTKPLLAIAAAIAIAGGLIGTGNAQQGIGAAGMGIIAEKPEKFGQVLFFFVIPETLWIIGFVLGIILLLGIL
ncbi:MAG: F0F1 ATP synthase subunit C [Thermoproteota archaeon]|nr:F0F1 ATP synthase subunit C [Thermoproteota archaeon]